MMIDIGQVPEVDDEVAYYDTQGIRYFGIVVAESEGDTGFYIAPDHGRGPDLQHAFFLRSSKIEGVVTDRMQHF